MKNNCKICVILPGFSNGGIEKVLYNYLSKIFSPQMLIDFVVFESQSMSCLSLFKKIANKVFFVTPKRKNYFKYKKEIKQIIKNGNYDVVHSNLYIWNDIPLKYAYQYYVPIRISHCHLVVKDGLFKKVILRRNSRRIKKFATQLIGCSKDACEYLYGKGLGTVLPNAFDFNNFYFNNTFRKEIRARFKIKEDKFVVGHIGRLSEQKNHKLMIEIAKIFKKKNINACFLCVGCGELEHYLKSQINEFHLEDFFILAGETNEPFRFYSAFDLFCFPSLYEGLGISLVEAQISGLPCVISNVIPKEGIISNRVFIMDLSCDPYLWEEKIENVFCTFAECDRTNSENFLLNNASEYEIDCNTNKLKSLYGIEGDW